MKKRVAVHKRGREAFLRGANREAIEIFQEGLKEFGPHVGLLADMACAAYLDEDMGAFRLFVERLEWEFRVAYPKLSVESRINTHVTMAKFHEEFGRISNAFDQIQNAFDLLPPGHPLFFQICAQRLRLTVCFGDAVLAGRLYRECAQISQSQPQTWIECGHALLLAEARIFGLATALPRLGLLLQSEDLRLSDPRLLIFDLLEIALEKNDSANRDYLLKVIQTKGIEGFDTYENAVLAIARGAREPFDILSYERRLPVMGLMRLLAMWIARDSQSRILRERMNFLLRSFDMRDRRYLVKKWNSLLRSTTQVRLHVDTEKKTLRRDEYEVSLKNSPWSWTLFEFLTRAPDQALAPSDVGAALMQRSPSARDLESLRIALLRLENKLRSHLQVDWVFRYGKNEIKVNPTVTIVNGPAEATADLSAKLHSNERYFSNR